MDRVKDTWRTLLVCLLLAGATLAAFWPVAGHQFLVFDDLQYVAQNEHVTTGLTWANARWAMTSGYASNWHPLTWLSHMLDVQLFGLEPKWHHLTNLFFHTVNSLLLLLLLRRLTGAFWRSAFVAALFALHPLHVESVAWVAERKDLLSALFFFLTLWAYANYVSSVECRVMGEQNPTPEIRNPKEDRSPKPELAKAESGNPKALQPSAFSLQPFRIFRGSKFGVQRSMLEVGRSKSDVRLSPPSSPVTCHPSLYYALALLLFALGLMSKPMLVTLPFVLLLLDYWPLRRVTSGEWRVAGGGNPKPEGTQTAEHAEYAEAKPGWSPILSVFRVFRGSKFEVHGSRFKVAGSTVSPPPPLHHSTTPLLRLVVEKLPFLALSAASSAITLLVQDTARVNPDDLPLSLRLGNAALSCAAYLRQTFWPTRLAVFYPYPADWPWGGLGVAVLLLLGITVAGLRLARRWPWGIVGWLWYLGMLVPVLGVVQVGQQARADRYSYLPLIGIFVVVSWGLGWAKAAGRGKKEEDRNQSSEVGGQKSEGEGRRLSTINYQPSTLLLSGGAIAVLAGLGVTAHWQVGHWQSSTTIFEHACRVTKDNYVAWGGLGVAEVQRGNWDRAVTYLNRALECPRCFTAADNCKYYLGLALQRQGKPLEALPYLQTGIVVPELWPDATYRLGLSLIATGRLAEAEVIVQKAIDARPRNPEFRLGMASLLRRQGKTADAIRQLDELLMLEPTNALVNLELAELLSQQGRKREAVARYDQALAADPKSVTVLNNLAWMLATDADDRVRNGPRAVELAQRACQLSEWKAAVLMGTLAAAYAEAGRFADAAAMAEKARDHARADKQEDVAKRNEELLERYRAGKPYHEER